MAGDKSTRRKRSGPTIADVASAAGVSPMTVSRVINRDARVRPDTRGKVTRAISSLGYVPNLAARSLAGARQCRILLLHTNPSSAYLSEFLLGSLASARESGAELVVEQYDPGEEVASLLQRLAAHRIDGVLLPPPLCDDGALIAALRNHKLAIAQVGTGRPVARAHAVSMDDESAAFTMTAHLIDNGHRRIGFISGPSDQTVSKLRLRGYERALLAAGLETDAALIVPGDFTYQSGLHAAEALLSLPDRPTAIFAANDDMAAAAVGFAHRSGLHVPGDVTICGFDDTPIATTIWPELTTIRQPISQMARRAIDILVGAICRGDGAVAEKSSHVQLGFELIRRQSDGPIATKT